MTYLLLIAAGVIWLWPRSAPANATPPSLPTLTPQSPPQMPSTPTFHASLMAVSLVRQRLVSTSRLSDPCSQAIDSLVLALVQGSDQP